MSPRSRNLWIALACLAAAWVLALGGFALVRHLKPTPDKVRALLQTTDLSGLSPEERRKVLQRLADLLNALSPEDRRLARMAPEWRNWIAVLSESEKAELLELTLPSGITQMLASFEEMPPERRRRLIEDSLRQLREARLQAETEGNAGDGAGPGGPGEGFDSLSPEMRERVVAKGLRTFMEEGSADTRAQLQPLVEEMQRSMESGRGIGRPFGRRRQDGPRP